MTETTLRADLAALLATAGIVDVDINQAIADEHVRSSAYRRIVAVAASSQHRDNDRALASALLRDPMEMVAKAAVVDLVDNVAMGCTNPVDFRQWSAELLPEIDLLKTEANRRFLRDRIHDWTLYLAIEAGHTPTPAELAGATAWMQRRIAEESSSPSILALLAECGGTKKIRSIAKNRAMSREIRKSTDTG